jgi:hypothetical protein
MANAAMTAHLILKRASASRPSGVWKDEDYDVLADGKVVGRIYEEGSRFGPPELWWGWSITAIVLAIPNVTNGHAPTLDEAKAKFREAAGCKLANCSPVAVPRSAPRRCYAHPPLGRPVGMPICPSKPTIPSWSGRNPHLQRCEVDFL